MSWIKKLKGAIKIAKVEMPVVAANLPSRDYEVLETRAYAMDAITGFTMFGTSWPGERRKPEKVGPYSDEEVEKRRNKVAKLDELSNQGFPPKVEMPAMKGEAICFPPDYLTVMQEDRESDPKTSIEELDTSEENLEPKEGGEEGRREKNYPKDWPQCYYCRGYGHIQKNCWQRVGDEEYGDEGGAGGRKPVPNLKMDSAFRKCYFCQAEGHLVSKCPVKRAYDLGWKDGLEAARITHETLAKAPFTFPTKNNRRSL